MTFYHEEEDKEAKIHSQINLVKHTIILAQIKATTDAIYYPLSGHFSISLIITLSKRKRVYSSSHIWSLHSFIQSLHSLIPTNYNAQSHLRCAVPNSKKTASEEGCQRSKGEGKEKNKINNNERKGEREQSKPAKQPISSLPSPLFTLLLHFFTLFSSSCGLIPKRVSFSLSHSHFCCCRLLECRLVDKGKLESWRGQS